MIIGTVTAMLQPRVRSEYCGPQALAQVMTDGGTVVAADLAGARPGDKVLLLTGAGALRCCMSAPADAVITAIVQPDGP